MFNFFKNKKIFFSIIAVACFFVLTKPVLAVEETRTITTFVAQDSGERIASDQLDQPFTFTMLDDIVDIKSAFFEISGSSVDNSAQTVKVALEDTTLATANTKTYTLDTTGGPTPFKIIYDATSIMSSSGNNCYVVAVGTYNCTFSFRAETVSVFNLSVKLITTYRYTKASSAATEETNTITTFVVQDSGERALNIQLDQPFAFTMTDDIIDIKSAFFEITGSSAVDSAQTIKVSLDDTPLSSANTYALDTTGGPTPFKIIYDVTTTMTTSGNNCYIYTEGTYNCTFSFKAETVSVYNLSVKLITTYRFRPVSSCTVPTSGTYISPVFDSNASLSTIAAKSGFNTISWIEDVSNGTLVKYITIAVDSVNSPATFLGPTGDDDSDCDASSTCTGRPKCEDTNTCYSRSNITNCSSVNLTGSRYEVTCRVWIDSSQQNLQYFRYKIKLCNENQCSACGNYSPKVEQVILNWSP